MNKKKNKEENDNWKNYDKIILKDFGWSIFISFLS